MAKGDWGIKSTIVPFHWTYCGINCNGKGVGIHSYKPIPSPPQEKIIISTPKGNRPYCDNIISYCKFLHGIVIMYIC